LYVTKDGREVVTDGYCSICTWNFRESASHLRKRIYLPGLYLIVQPVRAIRGSMYVVDVAARSYEVEDPYYIAAKDARNHLRKSFKHLLRVPVWLEERGSEYEVAEWMKDEKVS